MKKTTNIYILADTSYTMTLHRERLAATLAKMSRALGFVPEKTKLHIWGYSDRAHIIDHNDGRKSQPRGRAESYQGRNPIRDEIRT